jgi:hypothetical protein
MMAVSAVGELSVNCLQMSLDRHMCRGISINQSEIFLQFAFDAFKLGSGLLPDAIMVLIIIEPANLNDSSRGRRGLARSGRPFAGPVSGFWG